MTFSRTREAGIFLITGFLLHTKFSLDTGPFHQRFRIESKCLH